MYIFSLKISKRIYALLEFPHLKENLFLPLNDNFIINTEIKDFIPNFWKELNKNQICILKMILSTWACTS